MYLCCDKVDYGTERDTTDYILNGNKLVLRTYTVNIKEHTNTRIEHSVELPEADAKRLVSMTEEQRLEWLFKHQFELFF